MKYLKLLFAFAFGWLSVIAIGMVADAVAQKGKGSLPTPLQKQIAALEDRVKKLEQASADGKLVKKVAAPFEVVDRSGQRVFYVSPERDVEYYRGGKRIAVMSAGGDIGTFWTFTTGSQTWASWTSERMVVNEDGKTRMELGKGAGAGNYRLLFYTKDGKWIGGIGESSELNTGLAFLSDASGNVRARIGETRAGIGAIDVLGSDNKLSARFTEGAKGGGVMLLCSANSCDPPMVDAGDLGGYGVVRTGPQFYNPGVGLMGVPGSFLIGKH